MRSADLDGERMRKRLLDREITSEMLPPAGSIRWGSQRKALVLSAIRTGLLTQAEATRRYGLSPEELTIWQWAENSIGITGLKITSAHTYRDRFREYQALQQPAVRIRPVSSARR